MRADTMSERENSHDIFNYQKKAHSDLALPALRHDESAEVGWGINKIEPTSPNGHVKMPDKEMLETLTILDAEEAFLLPIDNALAYAYGESLTLDFNARLARSTIAKKGKGREDAKTMVGAVKQSISIPTVLSKVREKLTGGKKEEEVESNQLQ